MPSIHWDSKVATVAGKHAAKMEKAFGVVTVGDLLRHYPRRYVEKGALSDLAGLEVGEHTTVIGEVSSVRQATYQDRRSHQPAFRTEVAVKTLGGVVTMTFFDKRKHLAVWRKDTILPGTIGMFSGKAGLFRRQWQLTNPQTKMFGADREGGLDEAFAAWDKVPALMTLYPATSTVQSWQVEEAIALALQLVDDVPEPLPEDVRRARGLLGSRQALEWIHRPESWEQRGAAQKRLRFEEAFVTQAVLAQRRSELLARSARPRRALPGGLLDRFDDRLPFDLTEGQQAIGEQLHADLGAVHPMHRLLQGEVGSGKTVVALRAMLRVVDAGGQAALLAPTEVLAQQHHRSITGMLGDLAAGGMLGGAEDGTRVALLTGSLGSQARREAMLDAASGAAGIVIGTHALLEQRVEFADLGLVVVDEQHRFGVEQRAALAAKADDRMAPHVLVMTATPIPRTVAMTVFGDLETSTLTELPAGRGEVQTSVVPVTERPEWLDRAWARVREEVGQGRQVYVVCPRISAQGATSVGDEGEEPGDGGESGGPELASVEEVTRSLAEGPLAEVRLEPLHGRLPGDRKEAVMAGFVAREVDVLVSTTVIEVGVDVPNASVMVVLDADRFGVSQLHQLRGRIGRGGLPGLCLLVTRAEEGTPARSRLDAVAATRDGFELSRVDLEQRREGDVLGAAQSGRRSSLRLLSVLHHEDVITDARGAAEAVVAADPTLLSHHDLADALRRLADTDQADYLEKT